MSNYFPLVKTLLKSIRRVESNNKRTKHLFRLLTAFTIMFIIIPFLLISASFIYDTTIQLLEIEYETIGLKIMCYVMCIFTFIFSFSVLLNELFLSNDIEKLIPLPIKPIELLASKFTMCFILENIIQVVLTFACILGYVMALNIGAPNILLSVIAIEFKLLFVAYLIISSIFKRLDNNE